ncbi:MAG: hypothetical protein ACYCO3_16860 [Mycobacteriales bacterium]
MTTATISALPTPWARLEAGLRARRPVEVSYHGRLRIICPHALGWTHGRPLVLGYQSGGQTSTAALDPDPHKRWRCMYVDEIDHAELAEAGNQWRTADNYNASHPFPAIDNIAIAIPAGDTSPAPLR